MIVRILVGITCVPLIWGYGSADITLFRWIPENLEIYRHFGAGFSLAFVVWLLVLRRRLSFWETFEHELTHTIFSVIMFKGMHQFSATRDEGGFVVQEGSNMVTRLAPYFFPTPVMPFLVLRPLVHAAVIPWVDGLIGAALLFHVVSTIHETGLRQTDITRSGVVVSLVLITLLHLVFLGLILTVVGRGWAGTPDFLADGVREAWHLLPLIQSWLIF